MLITEKDRLLSTDELAEILGLSPATLRTWRWSGVGPKYFRLNGIAGPVRFRQEDVESWLNEQAIDPARKVKNKEG